MEKQTLIIGRAHSWPVSLVFIESNQAIQQRVTERFRKLGYPVTSVTTDAEAMQLLSEDPRRMLLVGDVDVPATLNRATKRHANRTGNEKIVRARRYDAVAA